MKNEQIVAKVPKLDAEIQCDVQMPESLEEARQVATDAAILDNAIANYKVVIQAAMRRLKLQGKTNQEIQDYVSQMKMGVSGPKVAVDPFQAAAARFAMMTPEEQAAYIAQLKGMTKKGK